VIIKAWALCQTAGGIAVAGSLMNSWRMASQDSTRLTMSFRSGVQKAGVEAQKRRIRQKGMSFFMILCFGWIEDT
jgi:hypothetical protein